MKFTGGKGVDVLYDNIANPTVLPLAFHAIGMNGRLVTAGAHAGPNVTIDFSHLYTNASPSRACRVSRRPTCRTACRLRRKEKSFRRSSVFCRCRAPWKAHRMVENSEGQAKSYSIRRWDERLP